MCKFHRPLAALMASLLVVSATAQQPGGAPRLKIVPLEGHNAVNYLVVRAATPPVVEVRDENDRPVEGAQVTFKLPTSGPGATTGNGEKTQTTTTDIRGQAGVQNYTTNTIAGRFIIEVTAAYQDRTAQFLMVQTNSLAAVPPELGGPKKSNVWKWVIVGAIAGAGAGLGVYFGTRGGNTPISVAIGSVGVGGPR